VPRPDGGDLIVTAVPAVHGPEDAERDADGFVNTEVIGFVLSGPDLPVIYVSGDNASIATVAEIARRTPSIDAVVLHAGGVHPPFEVAAAIEPRRPPAHLEHSGQHAALAEAALDAYMQDERRLALAPERERAIARTQGIRTSRPDGA